MEELLLQLVLAVGELFLEALLEFGGELLTDLLSRAVGAFIEADSQVNPVFAAVGYAILGALAGGASILVFPHPLVRPSRVHGISLLLSPLATGSAMSLIGSTLQRQNKRVVKIESFGCGFAFAFGMALIRLLLAK